MAFDEGAMIVIDFTQEAIEALNYQRYHHPHPRVQRKMEALWLKSQGLPHHQICGVERYFAEHIAGLRCANIRLGVLRRSNNSITTYRTVNCTAYQTTIRMTIFGANPPATNSLRLCAKIYELTGIQDGS